MTHELGKSATAAVFALLLAACGGEVVAAGRQSGDQTVGSGASGDASSGQGGAGTTSTSSGFGGIGSSATTGAGGTPAGCAGAFIEVTMAGGTTTELGSVCSGDWGAQWSSVPVGYYVSGGAAELIQSLHIAGCASATENAGLSLFAQVDGPGAYGGNALYTDSSNNQFPDSPPGSMKLVLTSVGKIGEAIEGNYAAMVAKDEIGFTIEGAFRVCHVQDENLP